ncbi:MAG: L-threonylcarbamoyladenylate synthase [Schleiferiaceae bacterium]|jgi:tRNA threonylcarbamoyl adenosine modification protein (Sua5/YciO/YrdC/YwlC family)|nr:MAG: Threonylcarbamoyl-AMP synthase [Cryomorphaceae bacterium]
MVYSIFPESINLKTLQECVERFERGEVAIIPTDSVYAVAGDFQHPAALKKLAQIKGEKVKEAEFSFLFTDLSQVAEYTQSFNGPTFKLLKKCLPGPYTMVLEANINLAKKLGQKRKTIGVRIPDNTIVLALCEMLGRPLASTSLHHDDDILQYPTDPDEIVAQYADKADFMIDGGWGDNVPSTVIDLSSDVPSLIRAGKGDPDVI